MSYIEPLGRVFDNFDKSRKGKYCLCCHFYFLISTLIWLLKNPIILHGFQDIKKIPKIRARYFSVLLPPYAVDCVHTI